MRGFSAARRQIAACARAQHGLVTRAQLPGLGLSTGQVESGIARGELRIIHRGVYLYGAFERDRRKTAELEELGGIGGALELTVGRVTTGGTVKVHRVTRRRIGDELQLVVAEVVGRLRRAAPHPRSGDG